MTKKKKNAAPALPPLEELIERPWCYYCERDFDDVKVLTDHQRAKHFRCDNCGKRLSTIGGLCIHVQQVHKEAHTQVANALPHRNSVNLEIFGMCGIPEEDLDAHKQRVTKVYFERQNHVGVKPDTPKEDLDKERSAQSGEGRPKKKARIETPEELKKRLAEWRARRAEEKRLGLPRGALEPPSQDPSSDAENTSTPDPMAVDDPKTNESTSASNPPGAAARMLSASPSAHDSAPYGIPPSTHEAFSFGANQTPIPGVSPPPNVNMQYGFSQPSISPFNPAMTSAQVPAAYPPINPFTHPGFTQVSNGAQFPGAASTPTTNTLVYPGPGLHSTAPYSPVYPQIGHAPSYSPTPPGVGPHFPFMPPQAPPMMPQSAIPTSSASLPAHYTTKKSPGHDAGAPGTGSLPKSAPGLPTRPPFNPPNVSKEQMAFIHAGGMPIGQSVNVSKPAGSQLQLPDVLPDSTPRDVLEASLDELIKGEAAKAEAKRMMKGDSDTARAHNEGDVTMAENNNNNNKLPTSHANSSTHASVEDESSGNKQAAKTAKITHDPVTHDTAPTDKKKVRLVYYHKTISPEEMLAQKAKYAFDRRAHEHTQFVQGDISGAVTAETEDVVRDPQDTHP